MLRVLIACVVCWGSVSFGQEVSSSRRFSIPKFSQFEPGSPQDQRFTAMLVDRFLLNDDYFPGTDGLDFIDFEFLNPIELNSWQFYGEGGSYSTLPYTDSNDWTEVIVMLEEDGFDNKFNGQPMGMLLGPQKTLMILGQAQTLPEYDADYFRFDFCDYGSTWNVKLVVVSEQPVSWTMYNMFDTLLIQHSPVYGATTSFQIMNLSHPQMGSSATVGLIPYIVADYTSTRYMMLFQRANSVSEDAAADCLED